MAASLPEVKTYGQELNFFEDKLTVDSVASFTIMKVSVQEWGTS